MIENKVSYNDINSLLEKVKDLDLNNPINAVFIKFINKLLDSKQNEINKVLLMLLFEKIKNIDPVLLNKLEEGSLIRKDGKMFMPSFSLEILIGDYNSNPEFEHYDLTPEHYITLPFNMSLADITKEQLEVSKQIDVKDILKEQINNSNNISPENENSDFKSI